MCLALHIKLKITKVATFIAAIFFHVRINTMHAVHKLHHYRMSLSTTTYKSRGQRVIRCDLCRLAKPHCICPYSPKSASNAGFLLLMYDTEVLKPSNTGKLIADVVPDTFAFLWSRTKENKEMLAILNDEQWQPYVVFPQQYAQPERQVFCNEMMVPSGKRPLFVMLDGLKIFLAIVAMKVFSSIVDDVFLS